MSRGRRRKRAAKTAQPKAPPPGRQQRLRGGLRPLARQFWHWLILAVSIGGAAMSGRLAYGLWKTAAEEAGDDPPYLMWGLSGAAALLCAVFLREILYRIRALRHR